ncbi:MAG: tRNA lysidine(34) synthetase TilS [Spirochaetales bacterium]|nr:tRNA lysidine(34) synthetase TilS [Spirochaetales bacterium]
MLVDYARQIELWPPGKEPEKIAVAVSGGADSLFLLHLLHDLKKKGSLRSELLVYHLNHRLRATADRDLQLVIDAARSLDLPLYLRETDVLRLARRLRTSVETAGRQVRYRQLQRLAPVAATGHNADDFVESLLLHLCRGAGPAGLGGMKRFSCVDGLWLWRPLLTFTAVEIRQACQAARIDYAEDESNASLDYKRNRIRQTIMPALKAEGLNPARLAGQFLQAHAETGEDALVQPISTATYVCVDRLLLPGRLVLARAFAVLSVPPPSRAFFLEFSRQWARGRLYMENQELILWASPQSPLWLIRKDAPILRPPGIGPISEGRWPVAYNGQSRTYRLDPGYRVDVFSPGMRFETGRSLKNFWHICQFPRPLRSILPLIVSEQGLVNRACTEFIKEFRLISHSTSSEYSHNPSHRVP